MLEFFMYIKNFFCETGNDFSGEHKDLEGLLLFSH